jgi:hypothetical protein
VTTPAQQDEADVVEEVGAEENPETGDLAIDEDKVKEVGALDVDSVRENKRLDALVGKKRANMKGVPFNVKDLLVQFDNLTRWWPPNQVYITVRRLTGSPVQHTITSEPKNGPELYEALRQLHGPNAEATYEVSFVDHNSKHYLAKGTITMPDARGAQQQQGQPMQPPYGGYPPQYPHVPQQPAYGGPVPQQQPPGFVPQQPAVPSPAAMAGMDFNALLALQKQQFEFWQAAQKGHPAAAPAAAPGGLAGMDSASFMAFMQQQFDLWRQAHGAGAATPAVPAAVHAPPGMTYVPNFGFVPTERLYAAVAPPAAQPPPPVAAQPQPMQAAMPPVQPPPGMVFVPGWGMVSMEALAQAQAAQAGVARPPSSMAYRPPYAPRPAYYAQGDGAPPPGPAPYGGQQRPKTAAEEFRDAVSIVETAVNIADRFRPPAAAAAAAEPEPPADDDSPVRIIDTGPAKILVNRDDGKLRAWETGWANLDKIMKFVGEQADAYRKAQAERGNEQQQQRPKVQPPPGYIEVGPDGRPLQQPPPGFVVGPPMAMALPSAEPAPVAAPAAQPQMADPPPMTPMTEEEPPRRRTWGMPPTPGSQ